MNISRKLLAILLIAFTAFFAACADDDGGGGANNTDTTATTRDDAEDKNDSVMSSKAAEKDAQFVVDEVASHYGEVKLAKLGAQKSSSTELKAVAKMLEAEHAAVLNDLKSIASVKNITIPTEENGESKDKLKELTEEKASEFDKEWCEMSMDSHKNSISRFENVANDISDPDLKNFVNTVLPKLRIHHDKLMECHKKLK